MSASLGVTGSSTGPHSDKDQLIRDLESEVEQQRQLRMADAKQVRNLTFGNQLSARNIYATRGHGKLRLSR